MRIGISGKGGVGKTTISAVVARTLARRGHRVIAIDCDSDPNLGVGIGLGEQAELIRSVLDQSGPKRHVPVGLAPVELLGGYGFPAPDGVTILLGARAEKAGSGCTGAAHVTIREFIEFAERDLSGTFVIADMEAGLEHLSWAGGTLRHVDMLLVVLQPTSKVLLTADRTNRLADELGIADVAFIANRAGEDDRERLEAFARDRGRELLAFIPDDQAVLEADRRSECLLDWAPESAAVGAMQSLADVVELRGRRAPVTA